MLDNYQLSDEYQLKFNFLMQAEPVQHLKKFCKLSCGTI